MYFNYNDAPSFDRKAKVSLSLFWISFRSRIAGWLIRSRNTCRAWARDGNLEVWAHRPLPQTFEKTDFELREFRANKKNHNSAKCSRLQPIPSLGEALRFLASQKSSISGLGVAVITISTSNLWPLPVQRHADAHQPNASCVSERNLQTTSTALSWRVGTFVIFAAFVRFVAALHQVADKRGFWPRGWAPWADPGFAGISTPRSPAVRGKISTGRSRNNKIGLLAPVVCTVTPPLLFIFLVG